MNNALILGCSHAAGSEMINGEDKSYPVMLANKLGYNAINCAIGGGSNDAMFRIFEQYCDLGKINDQDIVIACWTGSERTETMHNNSWTTIVSGAHLSPIKDYIKQWCVYNSDRWHWRLNKIKNIIALNSIAEKRNIKIINIDSFNPIEGFDCYDIYKAYHWPCAQKCFVNWCLDNKFAHTPNGHFFEDAHSAFANYAYSACLHK